MYGVSPDTKMGTFTSMAPTLRPDYRGGDEGGAVHHGR